MAAMVRAILVRIKLEIGNIEFAWTLDQTDNIDGLSGCACYPHARLRLGHRRGGWGRIVRALDWD